MKIWLPIELAETGGVSSFASKFKQGMEQRGHQVHLGHSADNYDLLLASPRASLPLISSARRQGKRIIHRLDGAYYPATPAGWLFPAYNAPLTAIQYLSHFTIYQSHYARRICQLLIGPRSSHKSAIVYNGVDTALFSPDGPLADIRRSADEHLFFTAQQFRRSDQIQPLVHALAAYRDRYHVTSRLVVAGDFVREAAHLAAQLAADPHIQLIGPVPNSQLPTLLRAADAFVYCHPNPACPNNVLEAMAAGLPVIGIADGAMPELVRHQQDGYLISLPGRGHLRPRRFNPRAFAAAMHQAIENKAKLSHSARARAVAKFSLDRMIDRYISTLSPLTPDV